MTALIITALVLAAAVFLAARVTRALIGKGAVTAHRAWAIRRRILIRLRPADGFADLWELIWAHSRRAAFFHGKKARPSLTVRDRLTMPVTGYAVRHGRAQVQRNVYGRMQDQELILAPPQTGKSTKIAGRLLDHPGPVLCTSTRGDLFHLTAGHRALTGPVHTFDPLGYADLTSTFGWDIILGCEDSYTAIRRAQDLTGDYATGDMRWWQCKASAALAALLHAAALRPVTAATIMDVYAWVHGSGDADAQAILEDHAGEPGRLMLSVLKEIREGGRTAQSVRATISEALTWVAVPALAAAAMPPPGHSFNVQDFLLRRGTLYMVAPGSETAPVASLFQAFVQNVHYEAGLLAAQMPGRKLDPPLWLALDEVTQICPVPLPAMLADSAGKGILITGVIHSYGQLVNRWGSANAETVWATCATKVLFGGITDPQTLEHVSTLGGVVGVKMTDGVVQVPAVPVDLLRMLPKYRALILSLNLRPVVVKTRPVYHWWNRYGVGRKILPAPRLTATPRPLELAPFPVTEDTIALDGVHNGHH